MRIPNGYGLPITVSLLLHVGIVLLLLTGWSFSDRSALQPVIPNHVQAKLVTYEPPPQAPKKSKTAPVPVAKPKPKPVKKSEPDQKALALKKKQEQQALALKRKKEEAARREKERRQQEAERKKREELARKEQLRKQQEQLMQQQFQQALASEQEQISASEQAAAEAKQNAELTSSYSALVNERIRMNWSRPPSARNGMTVVLQVGFVPTGEVANVNVLKSSGNEAFDRSAVQAVKLTGRIPELQDLASKHPRLFDRQFRRLQITFRPEDLLR